MHGLEFGKLFDHSGANTDLDIVHVSYAFSDQKLYNSVESGKPIRLLWKCYLLLLATHVNLIVPVFSGSIAGMLFFEPSFCNNLLLNI